MDIRSGNVLPAKSKVLCCKSLCKKNYCLGQSNSDFVIYHHFITIAFACLKIDHFSLRSLHPLLQSLSWK